MKTTLQYLLIISLVGLLISCEDTLFEEVPANTAEENFEHLWNTFNDKYAVFEQRNVNWQQAYDQFRPRVTETTSEVQLYTIITDMLSLLDDAHVSLMAHNRPFWKGKQEFREANKLDLFSYPVIRDQYIDGNPRVYDNKYAYGTINQNTGYLWVASLADGEPAFIDEFISLIANTQGAIIDLRHCDGGDFTNGKIIASRFTSERALAFSGSPKTGPGANDFAEFVDYYLEPAGPAQYTKPIVVLIDGYTVSAAENLALYFKTMPNVTFIGENSAGAMGERLEKEMPNGWVYSITGQLMVAADGNTYEGPGIPANIAIQNTLTDLEAGRDLVLDLAIQSLQ